MTKVSVIVQVYNVEKYLERCLSSLVKQTLKDIEILVINDGSPDDSQEIIDKFKKKYSNVKSYIKPNGGISDARNYGLKYASGEYISFIDSDDYVDITMMEKLYNKAKEKNYDIVECNLVMVWDDGKIIKKICPTLNMDIDNDEKKKNYMLNTYTSVWNKLYKKSLFKCGVKFKTGVWFEDVEFLYRLLPYVKTIGFVNDTLNYYVQREGSITRTFDKRLLCYIDNWNGIIDFYKKNSFYDNYSNELEYLYVKYLYASFIKQTSNYRDKKMFDKTVKMAKENVKQKFPNYRKNKYFYNSIKGIYLILFNKYLANLIFYLRRKR